MKNIITILLILIIPILAYLVIEKSGNEFRANAKINDIPSLYTFTSTMCIDCKKMKAVIKDVEEEYQNKVNFVSFNAMDNNKKTQEFIKKYSVVLVPTMVFIDADGNEINKIEGYIPKEDLIQELEALING